MIVTFAALLAAASLLDFGYSPPAEQGGTTIVVRGPERIICRPVAKTGTRIGVNARCRSRTEWLAEENRAGEYRTIEEASAKLAVIGDSCTPGPQGCD